MFPLRSTMCRAVVLQTEPLDFEGCDGPGLHLFFKAVWEAFSSCRPYGRKTASLLFFLLPRRSGPETTKDETTIAADAMKSQKRQQNPQTKTQPEQNQHQSYKQPMASNGMIKPTVKPDETSLLASLSQLSLAKGNFFLK